jgi:SpoIID/LytB domain protein
MPLPGRMSDAFVRRAAPRLAAAAGLLATILHGVSAARLVAPAQESGSTSIRIGSPRPGTAAGYDVETLRLEPYIARVLAGEALPGSEPAALEALAVAIRTYAASNMGRHRGDGFDLCDSTHCQVMRAATPQSERAAQATAGQVLLYNGALASIYYSASCGGRSELASAVWPGMPDTPYLPSQPDDGCGGDPVWRAEIALADLQRSLQASGYRGVLRDMRVLARNGSGRVAMLALEGLTPSRISGQDLRVALGATLGWQHVRSTLFELRRQRNAFRFEGRGFGHGVGMCVIGSAKRAAAGESAPAILQRYYPGTVIGSVSAREPVAPPPAGRVTSTAAPKPEPAPAAGIVVSVPNDEPYDRARVQEIASRAKDELAKMLGVAPPALVRIESHRTAEDFERISGRPWFTFGAVIDGNIQLMPVQQLAERGTLETTIRRQMVHLLTDSTLARRPAWVRSGAAIYFGDNRPDSATLSNLSRERCPADAELLRPLSPGGLSTAYAQAYGCFARQIANGRSWRDVR